MRPFIPLILLAFVTGCRQPSEKSCPAIDILMSQPAFRQIDSIEKISKGRQFTQPYPVVLASDYFPGRSRYKIRQPVFYRRPVSVAGPEVRYFFTRDSVVRMIEYRWEDKPEQPVDLASLFGQYRERLSVLTGQPGQLKELGAGQWKGRTLTWSSDRVFVQQSYLDGQDADYFKILVSWY